MGLFRRVKDNIMNSIQDNNDGWEEIPSINTKANQEYNSVPEYAKIKLLDTGLLQENSSVHVFLQKYGINTVGQILDENLMQEIKRRTTRSENVDFLIYFIKNKYEGASIPRTQFLDEKVKSDKNISTDIFGLNHLKHNNYQSNYLKYFEDAISNGFIQEDSTFIDFFRYLISDNNKYKSKLGIDKEIIELYVSDYTKAKQNDNNEECKDKQYNDILLKDTGLYYYKNILYNTLQQRGVTTVGQILDDELMFSIKKHTKYVEQLTLFIDIIKNQYLGIPLPQVTLFDEPINSINNDIKKFYFGEPYIKHFRNVDAEQFSFLSKKYVNLRHYGDSNKTFASITICIDSTLEFAYHNGYLNDHSTYLDFFKFLISEDNTWLKLNEQNRKILEIYINEYKKQTYDGSSESKKLESLQQELTKLTESRDNLNNQINKIINQIKEIEENNKTRGSM